MNKINYFLLLLSLLHQNLNSIGNPPLLWLMVEPKQDTFMQKTEKPLSLPLVVQSVSEVNASNLYPEDLPLQPRTTAVSDSSESVPARLALQKSKKDIKRVHACKHLGCLFIFHRKEHLARHMLIHSGERSFVCGVCHKSFSRPDNFQVHVFLHEKGKKKPIEDADGYLYFSDPELQDK
jgi:hypothetical protein